MPENIQTNVVVCEGGLNNQANPITIDPGEAIISINYESSLLGGYRRISGITKYDTAVVPGAGDRVLGVSIVGSGVLAARDNSTPNVDIYVSIGSGWGSKINTDTRTASGKHFFTKYNYTGKDRIIGVDGKNNPFRWEHSTTTYTLLNAAGSPADAKYVAEYKRHIFYSGYSSNTGAITFSVPLNEASFAAADGAGEIVVGDTVVALKKFRDELIIFCENSIYKLIGDSLFNFELLPISVDIGCSAADSVQEVGGDLYFLAPDGIRTLAATEKLGDVELASVSEKIQNIFPNILAATAVNVSSVIVHAKNQYRLFYPKDGDAVIDSKGIVGSIRKATQSWEWGELRGIKPFCADSDFISGVEKVVHGAYDGFVYTQESGDDFAGTAINSVLQTAYNHFDAPTRRKTVYKVTIFYLAEGTINVDIFVIYDYGEGNKLQPDKFTITTGGSIAEYGTSKYGTAAYGSAEIPRKKQTTTGSGFQTSLKFLTNDSNPTHTIQGFFLEYGLGGRR